MSQDWESHFVRSFAVPSPLRQVQAWKHAGADTVTLEATFDHPGDAVRRELETHALTSENLVAWLETVVPKGDSLSALRREDIQRAAVYLDAWAASGFPTV